MPAAVRFTASGLGASSAASADGVGVDSCFFSSVFFLPKNDTAAEEGAPGEADSGFFLLSMRNDGRGGASVGGAM